jgi:hypothetical protein
MAARRLVFIAGIVCLLAFLGLYHQPYYPVSWQDEGFVLQGAMNIARFGKYAMLSSEGFRILDQPLIANGPGVVLPITASFAAFGVGLLQARLVILLFMFWAVAMFFLLSDQLTGRAAAWISTILLLSATDEGFLYYGRIALGNMPALAYLLTGFAFWLWWVCSQKLRFAILSGIFFGLSVVTKSQAILVIPAFLMAAFIDVIYYRKTKLVGYVTIITITVACMLIWLIVQYVIVGSEYFTQHLAAIQSSSRVTIFVLRPERFLRNIWQFIISGMPIYFLPGLLWAIWSLRQKTLESAARLPFIVLSIIWLSWFVLFSIGWHRYFFDAAVIGMLFSGKLIVDAMEVAKITQSATKRSAALGLVGVFTIAVVLGLGENVKRITAAPDTTLQRFAEYLSQNVPSDAVVESWEWQIDPLVDLTFHHPTNGWVDRMTLYLTFGETPRESYDVWRQRPEYILVGSFSEDTNLYTHVLESGCCKMIYADDPYYLYLVNQAESD